MYAVVTECGHSRLSLCRNVFLILECGDLNKPVNPLCPVSGYRHGDGFRVDAGQLAGQLTG